jgi:hypothetical protein
MVSTLFFSQLVLVALGWLCVMLHWAWPSAPVAVRSTPRRTSARTRTGPIGAAGAGAISAPTAIPMGAPGANGGASPGAALCSRPSTRSRRASAPPANSSWASSRAWTQAWGSGARGGGARSLPSRCCSGWARQRISCRLAPRPSCMPCGSGGCSAMSYVRYSGRSRTAWSARPSARGATASRAGSGSGA